MKRHFRVLKTLEIEVELEVPDEHDEAGTWPDNGWHQGIPFEDGAVGVIVKSMAASSPLEDWEDLGNEVIEVDG